MARKADPVSAYARAVARRKVTAGPWVRLACARHIRDVKDQKKTGLVWRADLAQRAIDFFAECLILDSGKRFMLEDFQQFIVGSVFGWLGPDGYRRFRSAYVEMGKGSGKSPMAAGIGLYGLVADGEPSAEVYSAATTREQARIVWKDAEGMVMRSKELSALVNRQVSNLSVPGTGSVFRPLSADQKGLHGPRVHIALIDELHKHPSAEVVDAIRAGTKGRMNALIFEITNSGWDRHSVCWNHRELSLKVLQGIIENDAWFAYVCGLDEKDDWKDEKVWKKSNPGLGVTIPMRYLREQVAEAVGMPSKENLVRMLNFCEWMEQSTRAIPMDEWDRGAEEIDVASLRGRACFGGIDLARVCDLSAFVLLFPPVAASERWKVLCWFWVPEDDIGKRSHKDRVPYDVWAREEVISTTPGNTTDFEFIELRIIGLAGVYDIKEIAFDRTFAGEIIQGLQAEGLTMVEFGQGFLSMGAPTAELLRMVKAGELQHGGNPVLRWNASNLSVATDAAGSQKPDKEHSSEKIDGIVAICNALGRAMKQAKPEASPYSERGLIFI